MDTDSRFDRIESKIDKLTDAVTKIARVEEQLISSNRRIDKLETSVDKTETDINSVAELARNNASVSNFADKLFWIVITALVSFVFFLFK
jgi:septal ring factor EnvC (AmiA/AmiB activator)